MGKHLILDSEALNSIASAPPGTKAARRGLSIVAFAKREDATIVVPAVVVVEVYRGTSEDATLNRFLIGTEVVSTTLAVAKVAGGLLRANQMSSKNAIDALVVATAIRLGGGVIVTHDEDDLRRLAARHPNVKVFVI